MSIEIDWKINQDIDVEDDYINVGVDGCFLFSVNDRELGYILEEGYDGDENISYWVYNLAKAASFIKHGQKYEFNLLDTNMILLKFIPTDKLIISAVSLSDDKVIWSEETSISEFINVVKNSTKKYLIEIKKIHQKLLYAIYNKT